MLGVTRGMIFISGQAAVILNPMAVFGYNGFGLYLDDGTKSLWSWGDNTYGELGDNTTNQQTEPISVPGSVSWKYISAGRDFSIAIKSDDTCWAWGGNDYGQLGIHTSAQVNRSSPVSALFSGSFTKVISGASATLAIRSDGTLWAVGYNANGELGTNNTTYYSSPVSVVGDHTFTDVSAGNGFFVGLKADGTVWSWGLNNYGQLGNNVDLAAYSSPTSVVGDHSFTKITCGYEYTLALKADNSVWAWGRNVYGQLGMSNRDNYSSPVSVVTDISFKDIAASRFTAHGLDTSGYCWSWGYNQFGELGISAVGSKSSPVSVVGDHVFSSIFSDFGAPMTAAIRSSDGSLWTWGGRNQTFRHLGDGTAVNRSSPVSVLGSNSYTTVNVGNTGTTGAYTIAVRHDGTLWAFGNNSFGAYGNNTITNQSSPISVPIAANEFSTLSAGFYTSAGIKASDGSVWTWGYNKYGQLGNNLSSFGWSKSSPVSVLGNHVFTKVVGGSNFSIGLKADGSLWTTGQNSSGNLGVGDIEHRSSYVSVSGGHSFIDVSTGSQFAVAIRGDGTAWSWGSNFAGQLGTGNTNNASTPVSVFGEHTFTKVACGDFHVIALKSDGSILAWGDGSYGQLGTNEMLLYSTPVAVVGGYTFKDVAAGQYTGYGLDTSGHCWSWGINNSGELGINEALNSYSSPVSVVGDHVFATIFANDTGMAGGTKTNGSVWVWGNNYYGQLGIGNTDNQSSPVSVHNLPAAKAWRLTKGFEVNVLPGTDGGCSGIEAYTQGDNILTVLKDMTLGTVYMKLYDSSGNIYATNTGVGMIFPYSLTLNTIKSTNWTRWNGEVNVVQYSKWNTTDATAIVDWTYIDGSVWDWGKNQPLWYTGTQLNNENWAFITVERAGEGSPITALNYYITNCDATTVVDQTTLTSEVYSDYFVGHTDVYMCDTDDGGFAVLYRVNDGTNTITYNLYIRDSSGAEVVTLTGIEVTQIDGRNIFNVGGRLWVCFWDGPVTSPDSGYIRIDEVDVTLTKEITLDAGFVGNNGYIGKPGYFDTTPNAVVLFGCGGKYKLYNNSDLTLYSSGTLKVNSITPNFSGKCLTRDDGNVVWVPEMQGPNYPEWYLVELSTEYKY